MTLPRVLLSNSSEMAATDIDLHQARLRKRCFRSVSRHNANYACRFSFPAFHRSCCIAVTILLSKVPTQKLQSRQLSKPAALPLLFPQQCQDVLRGRTGIIGTVGLQGENPEKTR